MKTNMKKIVWIIGLIVSAIVALWVIYVMGTMVVTGFTTDEFEMTLEGLNWYTHYENYSVGTLVCWKELLIWVMIPTWIVTMVSIWLRSTKSIWMANKGEIAA